jgi:hypothetical protein
MVWFKGGHFDEGFRVYRESGGLIVAGRGRRIPVDSQSEAMEVITELYAASSTAKPPPTLR